MKNSFVIGLREYSFDFPLCPACRPYAKASQRMGIYQRITAACSKGETIETACRHQYVSPTWFYRWRKRLKGEVPKYPFDCLGGEEKYLREHDCSPACGYLKSLYSEEERVSIQRAEGWFKGGSR